MHILLDLDNTLLDFDLGQYNAIEKVMDLLEVDERGGIHQLYDQINKSLWRQLELGKVHLTDLKVRRFELFLQELRIAGSAEALASAYEQALSEECDFLEGAEQLLKDLSGNYNLHIASNGISYIQRPRIQKSGLDQFVKEIFISEEMGWAKPDTKYFQYIFNQLDNSHPHHYVMIGDNLSSDIAGGKGMRIPTIWFNPKEIVNQSAIQADYTVTQLADIPKIIQQIDKTKA